MRKRTGKIDEEIVNFRYQEETARTLLEMYLKEKKAINLSQYSIKLYSYHCSVYLDYVDPEGVLPVWKACTLENYRAYILHQQDIGTKDITIASQTRSIKAWFYWLMDNHCIADFKVVIPKYQETIPETYDDTELAALLKKPSRGCTEVEYETWVFINMAIATGLRLSSITSLKVENISFPESTISVGRTKNRSALKLVINRELADIIRCYIRIFQLKKGDYLFCTAQGSPLAKRTVEDFVRRYSMKRGVFKQRAIHAFRHTFAKNYYLQNHDMYRLKELMGHTLISTTEKYLKSLGLETSRAIEYNPQSQFIVKETSKKKVRRGKQLL